MLWLVWPRLLNRLFFSRLTAGDDQCSHAMRYAIVSDIHANLQAWEAAVADVVSLEIDHIICDL